MTLNDLGSSIGNFFSGLGSAAQSVNPFKSATYSIRYDTPQNPITFPQAKAASPMPTQAPQLPQQAPIFKPNPATPAGLGRNPELGNKPMSPQVQSAIMAAAHEFNVPSTLLFDIGYSEGGFRPDARNDSPEGQKVGVPVGLFQFTPGTWNGDLANYAKMPNSSLKNWASTMPREDPLANARAAAYLIKFGQLGRWAASSPNWGRFYSNDELAPYFSQTPGWKGLPNK